MTTCAVQCTALHTNHPLRTQTIFSILKTLENGSTAEPTTKTIRSAAANLARFEDLNHSLVYTTTDQMISSQCTWSGAAAVSLVTIETIF